jgi:hypothetical protein
MKGPKPVCAAAWKKLRPLSPSRAVGGAGIYAFPRRAATDATAQQG